MDRRKIKRHRPVLITTLLLAGLMGPSGNAQVPVPTQAPTQTVPSSTDPPVVLPPRVGISGESVLLSLEDVIALALKSNPNITIAQLEADVA